ncbi:hypothetical protein L1S45_06830 [Aeromonas dhakensis]|uniref:hypothetical protein n=2 Tax=Aeromonas dhakensis TaxID=196024 RepID=UPI00208F9F32|nr:hypothetical protein [Aeromonas dhakensis]USP11275.1 hypothetical protein L1S45_06830 [Aeromonas dhakensis]
MLLVAPLVFILLPPIERTTSGSWGLGQALLLILGALAGVELTLAQELQYVLGNTPLQAGMFIIPIMAAAAVGGPNAGYLFNLCSLRTVASSSLAISAAALCYLTQVDFHHPNVRMPATLALLGLCLSIGLTASSIANMDAMEADRGAGRQQSMNQGRGSGAPSNGVL